MIWNAPEIVASVDHARSLMESQAVLRGDAEAIAGATSHLGEISRANDEAADLMLIHSRELLVYARRLEELIDSFLHR